MTKDDDRDLLFSVGTPLGFRVHVTRAYWETIVAKHPELAARVEDVKTALGQPDEIRRSRRDAHVFYHAEGISRRWVVAVAKKSNAEGFLVTAYRTDAIKEGERVWPT